MNSLFDFCVKLLSMMAELIGVSYEEINVIIFCIAGPMVFFGIMVYIFYLRSCVRKLTKTIRVNSQNHNNL